MGIIYALVANIVERWPGCLGPSSHYKVSQLTVWFKLEANQPNWLFFSFTKHGTFPKFDASAF